MDETSVTVLDDPDQVAEALGGFRREILATMAEPLSATEIARRLDTTRQRVNYHLRVLEEAGLVELHEERPRRGLTERVMRRSSDVMLVSPDLFQTEGLSRSDVAGLSGVVTTALDVVRQAAIVSRGAGEAEQRIAAASLDGEIRVKSPAALRQMLDEIAAVVAHHDSGDEGLRVRVVTSVLPGVESK